MLQARVSWISAYCRVLPSCFSFPCSYCGYRSGGLNPNGTLRIGPQRPKFVEGESIRFEHFMSTPDARDVVKD